MVAMTDYLLAARRLQEWVRMLETRKTRMIIGHPDLCLFLSNFPRLDWKFMRKNGAKRGHLVLSLGWLSASVAW
jgi:hypothetical protein